MEIICGINAVIEVVRAGKRRVARVYIIESKRDISTAPVINEADRRKIPVKFISKNEFAKLVRIEKHQGVAAEVEPFKYLSIEELIVAAKKSNLSPFIIICDQIMDPHNLGAIIRTAHLVGAHGIVIPKDNSSDIGQVVGKASAGAVEYLPIAKVVNLNSAINELKNNNIWVVGTDGSAKKSIYEYDFKTGVGIVIGGEGKGLRRLVKEHCDELLSIPMFGKIGSYNASVAGAIIMAEVMRQRL